MDGLFIGVDVGTGSARAGVFDAGGRLRGTARRPIRLWREEGSIVEQSSADIWSAVSASVREAVAVAGAAPDEIRGLGFDATCSLVLVGRTGEPIAVGPSEMPDRDVVMWMDHRALAQSDRINAGGHGVLAFVGGAISPEMQTPKLLWLKENRPASFASAGHFFDLADYLGWRATGSTARSVCTLTCKWTFLAHENRWDADYFRAIGLGDLADEGFARIGTGIVDVATPLGGGLTEAAARDLGLRTGTPVGAPLIDAHAGALGTLGSRAANGAARESAGEVALITGTSACIMALTRDPVFVPGVWGPYDRALLPDAWLVEGGHSAYGAALDYLVERHPAHSSALAAATEAGIPLPELLERRALTLAGSPAAAARLGEALDIVPDFLGNRSPHADPHAGAVLSGLKLETSPESLTRLFVAALCGLCYGTAEIVAAMRGAGIELDTIVVSGGAARSPLLRRILADACGLRVALPETAEPVLLGGAMVGAVASGAFPDLRGAAAAMCRIGEEIAPDPEAEPYHARKREAYAILRETDRRIRTLRRSRP